MRTISLVLISMSVLALLALATTPVDAHKHGHHDGDRIDGSGKLETRDFDLDDFDAIDLNGSMDIKVTVGGKQSVSVKLDDNLFDNLKLEVKGSTLKIGWKASCDPHDKTEMVVSVSTLEKLRIDGAGDVVVRKLEGDRFEFDLFGAGDLEVDGEVDEFEININGAGDVKAFDLKAKQVDVSINGAGDAEVTATESFKGVVNGVGDITYDGDPDREKTRVSGIGSIERR